MRTLVVLSLAVLAAYNPARAEQSVECKACPMERKICRQAHSQQARESEYTICIKHCRKS